MNFVDSFNLLGVEARQIPCIIGNGTPTAMTEGEVGCLYMDVSSDTKDMYKCVAIENGQYVWQSCIDDIVIDQAYNPESESAQSGKAVSEAVSSKSQVQIITWEADD